MFKTYSSYPHVPDPNFIYHCSKTKIVGVSIQIEIGFLISERI
jgi:hypothetical protein